MSRSGFTLIETIIYIAILGVLLGSVLGIYYGFADSQADNLIRALVQSEANFAMRKISWGMTGAAAINQPASGATSTVLSIDSYEDSVNPIVFDLLGDRLRLARAGGTAENLTNSRVSVSHLEFTHLPAVGNQPEGISVSLTLQAPPLPATALATTTLTRTIYLRK